MDKDASVSAESKGDIHHLQQQLNALKIELYDLNTDETDGITNSAYNVLTMNIYTKPYPRKCRKEQLTQSFYTRKEIRDCVFVVLLILLRVIVLIGFCTAAYYLIIVGISELTDEYDVKGSCIVKQVIQSQDDDSEKTKWQTEYSLYDMPNCVGIKPLDYTFWYDHYDDDKQYVGKIVDCWTNQECTYQILVPTPKKYYTQTQTTIGVLAFLGASIMICSTFFMAKFMAYSVAKRCKICKNVVKKIPHIAHNWCVYFCGCDQKKYYLSEWLLNMDSHAKFDYFISYYSRQYNVKFSGRIFKLLVLYCVDDGVKNNSKKNVKWEWRTNMNANKWFPYDFITCKIIENLSIGESYGYTRISNNCTYEIIKISNTEAIEKNLTENQTCCVSNNRKWKRDYNPKIMYDLLKVAVI